MNKDEWFDRVCPALGMITSNTGFPLFFTVFPGNEQESSHIMEDIRKLEQALLDNDRYFRSIIVADAGLYSGDLIYRLAGENMVLRRMGEGYIIGRSINTVDKTTRNWVLNDENYHVFRKKKDPKAVTKIKSGTVPIEVNVKTPVGKKVKKTSEQKQVAIHSLKREHKAR